MKILIVLVSSIVFLSSCTIGSDTENVAITPQKTLSATNTGYSHDIDITSNKITESEEFQGCMKQNTNMCIQSAGMQIAQKTKDPTFCKELLTPEQRGSCEFAVTMINATEKNDEKICDTITDTNYQKQCKIQLYRQAAIAKKDITLCDAVDTVAKTTGTGEMFDANMLKDQCVMQYIMSGTSTNAKDCENLSNTGSLEMCKTMIKNRPTIGNMPSNMPPPPPVPAIQPDTNSLR